MKKSKAFSREKRLTHFLNNNLDLLLGKYFLRSLKKNDIPDYNSVRKKWLTTTQKIRIKYEPLIKNVFTISKFSFTIYDYLPRTVCFLALVSSFSENFCNF
jgi:hypothetical protein